VSEGSGAPQGTDEPPRKEASHGWRLFAIWLVLSAIVDPLYYIFAGPHIHPGACRRPPAGLSSTSTS